METTILIPARIRNNTDLMWLKAAIASAEGQGKILIGLNNCDIEVPAKLGPSLLLEGKNLATIRNALAQMVTTKFFFFLDHDDLLPPDTINKLEILYPTLAKNNEYLYGSTLMFGESSRLTIPAQPFNCEKLTRGVYFPNGVLQPTENFKTVGNWDEDLFILEDKEWWIRAVEKGICGTPVTFITYEYRQHGESMVNKIKGTPEWHAATEYIKKNHRQFFNGGYAMSGCCGKGKSRTPTARNSMTTLPKIVVNVDGTTKCRYMGSTGDTYFYGPYTGMAYKVSQKNPVINVDNRDAHTGSRSRPGLLEMIRNNHPVFTKVE